MQETKVVQIFSDNILLPHPLKRSVNIQHNFNKYESILAMKVKHVINY